MAATPRALFVGLLDRFLRRKGPTRQVLAKGPLVLAPRMQLIQCLVARVFSTKKTWELIKMVQASQAESVAVLAFHDQVTITNMNSHKNANFVF